MSEDKGSNEGFEFDVRKFLRDIGAPGTSGNPDVKFVKNNELTSTAKLFASALIKTTEDWGTEEFLNKEHGFSQVEVRSILINGFGIAAGATIAGMVAVHLKKPHWHSFEGGMVALVAAAEQEAKACFEKHFKHLFTE